MSNIGFIYKIVNCVDDDIYVGCTKTTLKERFNNHIHNTQCEHYKTIKLYLKMREIGIDKFKVEHLETVSFDDKYELYAREQCYMDELKPFLNMRPAPDKNYNHYKLNREVQLHKMKIYYEDNREQIIERVHKYASNNKDKISGRGKTYRQEHKEEIKERRSKTFICECGVESSYDHKSRHFRTKRHLEFMKTQICV